jgi:uncharacterized membrane protein
MQQLNYQVDNQERAFKEVVQVFLEDVWKVFDYAKRLSLIRIMATWIIASEVAGKTS